ncbi:MAG: glutamine synthetase III [Clostridia bacterium]|nr:glutamine synthetase III [Clostridia bacterium]
MMNIPEIFGSLVFNDRVMKERLPEDTYNKLKKSIEDGDALTFEIASVVASAMKDWAIEKGATHYTHWFQPLTGVTAEKHDSFITPKGHDEIIMEFSGKELIKGEPDASSFPSGGIRATFEARGYTSWDPTSYAFIKDNTLCIPTAFYSYGGEALDKKTPLLRSVEEINKQAMRIVRLFGDTEAKNVRVTVGPEQEYFLIDKDLYEKRKDLMYTGRTILGAKPPKGQEMDDHYFGAIKPRVAAFMKELDEELWKLGVLAKTEHNEAAPAQHELAPIYSDVNLATDHNQITMEVMKKTAAKHNLVCLLHEKPFLGVNGSGKHNNWSISTDTGINLLEPGKLPQTNLRFLLILSAVIKAVDEYQDLLRITVASAGNDHRLGAAEAPPAIVSMFLGDQLLGILESIEKHAEYDEEAKMNMEVGVHVLPTFQKDTTDRNRTSPFAFTGNKFEFRMPGSSFSIAGPNTILNTIVAEELEQFANELEASEDDDFGRAVRRIIRRTYREHRRIIFNGNNYSEEWKEEAKKRGLSNYPSTPEAIPHFADEKNVALFTKHNIYTKREITSRCEIILENYCKTVNIEALTMIDMVRKEVLPAVTKYTAKLSEGALEKKRLIVGISCKTEIGLVKKLSRLTDELYEKVDFLEKALERVTAMEGDIAQKATAYREEIVEPMAKLRTVADEIESNVSENIWPYPTYCDLLFRI